MNDENQELENDQTAQAADNTESVSDASADDILQQAMEQISQIESANTAAESGDSIESLREQLDEAEKRVLLHQADMENFRRRKSKETEDARKYSSLPLLNGLLEVHDNLERALTSAQEDENASSLRDGVKLVATQLLTTLENHGCKKIESVGQVFDPNRHEAIQMQADEQPANTIVLEAQSGFMLHDRVVRPAKVIISTGPAKA